MGSTAVRRTSNYTNMAKESVASMTFFATACSFIVIVSLISLLPEAFARKPLSPPPPPKDFSGIHNIYAISPSPSPSPQPTLPSSKLTLIPTSSSPPPTKLASPPPYNESTSPPRGQ